MKKQPLPHPHPSPKTFQEIATRTKQSHHHQQPSNNPIKPNNKESSIRKSNSQFLQPPPTKLANLKQTIHKLDFRTLMHKKQNKNNLQSNQKFHFKHILQQHKYKKEKKTSIATPSFLKNTKSFIHHHHQSQLFEASNQLYDRNDSYSINSVTFSDRNSEDLQLATNYQSQIDTISLNSSKSKNSNSKSNLINSTEIAKQLKELDQINLKIKEILNHSLNLGRKQSQENIKQKNKEIQHLRATHCSTVKLTESTDYGLQKIYKDSLTLSSINFSKKIKLQKSLTERKKIQITDFNLILEIGTGKYGKVYMSRHKKTGFICAIKCVPKVTIQQENIEIPFITQIKIQMYLNHPNIVKLYGFFTDNQNVYLIMEYCSGNSLLKLMKTQSTFQQPQILDVLSSILEAVSYIHCHGIIHRDIKPENIVIQNGIYKLCDFGWAAYARGDARTTFCGTPLYVSPEILKGQQYDAKTDIWGLGIITYELAYGRVPFSIWNQSDMRKIVNDVVYFPNWAKISQKMVNLIKSMLIKNPQERTTVNEILTKGIVKQYLNQQRSIKSQIEELF